MFTVLYECFFRLLRALDSKIENRFWILENGYSKIKNITRRGSWQKRGLNCYQITKTPRYILLGLTRNFWSFLEASWYWPKVHLYFWLESEKELDSNERTLLIFNLKEQNTFPGLFTPTNPKISVAARQLIVTKSWPLVIFFWKIDFLRPLNCYQIS